MNGKGLESILAPQSPDGSGPTPQAPSSSDAGDADHGETAAPDVVPRWGTRRRVTLTCKIRVGGLMEAHRRTREGQGGRRKLADAPA